MPLVSRTIEPRYLSRKSLFDENGRSLVKDYELEAISNNTLSNVLRQLASLVLVANDIFEDLAKQLQDVYERSCNLKTTITRVEEKLVEYDPKTVTVPESDICSFSLRTIHFKSSQSLTTGLFTASSRPQYLQKLYDSAGPTPIHTIRQLDRFRRDGARSSKFFVCTPVLSGRKKRYRKVDLEIETRKPMAVEDLRRWTSAEALGDITVLPDNTSKIPVAETTQGDETNDEVDHLLPSPEEQTMAVAMKFPPSIVAVDVSGKAFDRMSGMRRSLMVVESTEGSARRRTRRRHRGKRRNTIAGTSQKEIEQAIAGDTATETEGCEFEPLPPLRSRSTDLFKLPKATFSPTDNLKNHFNTLKNWSKTKLKFIGYKNNSMESCRPSFQGTDVVDDIGIYETVASSSLSSAGTKHKREKDRKQSSSSSAISIPASTSSMATSLVVKLRENSLQRRHWRKGANKAQDEPAHSSSGNWSASSESGRTSIASETTAPPKSSTTTSNNSLNYNNHHNHYHQHHHPPPSVQSRRRYLNTSTSSSVSEGTLTPDINDMHFHDFLDGETSSIYSCDTEGYYTSFHMDSGLKTLKEEEAGLSFSTLQLQEETGPSMTTTFNNTSSSGASTVKTSQQLTAENEYELFGKGSTSTTTSSAGTVCTTLLAGNAYGSTRSLSQFAPAVPERISSLERKGNKKEIGQIKEGNEMNLDNGGENNNDELDKTRVVALIHDSPSPDSGHNTSSSPAESESQKSHSPNEHLEFSESDLESCDRTERIRTKTAMTTCRIPSMCLITPPQSDDEVNLRYNSQVPFGVNYVPYEAVVSQSVIARNNQNVLNNQILGQANVSGKPLEIQIPKVVDLKKEITDIYAYPDKSKKILTDTVKTVSTNGVLETNIDSVENEEKNSLHLVVNGETGYATIKTQVQKTHRSPSPSGGLMICKGKQEIPKPSQPVLKPSLLPSNFMERFKEVLSKQKKPEKRGEEGDYVTIADSRKSPKTDVSHKRSAGEEIRSEYVSLNELPLSKTPENPLFTSNDNSLERKKRQGARVTLDSEGKVVYSSDSLKRRKQHTTFIPGKYVRESPTPSPIADKRFAKTVRPVNTSGLIRTNSEDKPRENHGVASPQTEKLIIKAGSGSCESPTKDFVRMPASRVITATNGKRRIDKGVRITLENGEVKNRSASPGSSDASSLERRKKVDRCVSPSSSSSSSTETKKSDINSDEGVKKSPRWISQHPSVAKRQQNQQQQQLIYSQSGFPRNHPMYWTLPARSVYSEDNRKAKNSNPSTHDPGLTRTNSSSHSSGAIKSCSGSCGEREGQKDQRNEFTSSTPTSKESLQSSHSINLAGGMSPILKENLFNPKSKMTAEEIFAAIHKSKKKLNLKDDVENRSESPQSSSSLSPDGSEKSLPNKSRIRSSWSPGTYEPDDVKSNEARTRRSWIGTGTGTPINSFKKLLLQQGVKNSPSKDLKISAVEQLKLSKNGLKANSNISRSNSLGLAVAREEMKSPPRGILSNRNRNQWRFASPRTDVLSSTIHEDCSEVEKPEENKAAERSELRFVRSDKTDLDIPRYNNESKTNGRQIETPRENKSLETTKRHIQQARKNFFGEPVSPNTVGLPSMITSPLKTQFNLNSDRKTNQTLLSPYKNIENKQNTSNDRFLNGEKKRAPIISLETAL